MQTFKFTDITANYIIFDMDGVLVNSAPVTRMAAKSALSEIGICADGIDFTRYAGTGEKNFILGPCRDFEKLHLADAVIDRFYEIFDNNVEKMLKVFPKVHETLAVLKSLGIPLAIASSSASHKLDSTLVAAKINKELFDVIVSGDDVSEAKPSPQIFSTAISRLGAAAENCLVVEDAISGIFAAKAAGARCFAVTTTFSNEILSKSGADFVGNAIDEIFRYIPNERTDTANA